jgi:hypothetical protein
VQIDRPTILYEDNLGAVQLAANPVKHSLVKHLDIKLHFTREQVQRKVLEIVQIGTHEQHADLFTKGLDLASHKRHTAYVLGYH